MNKKAILLPTFLKIHGWKLWKVPLFEEKVPFFQENGSFSGKIALFKEKWPFWKKKFPFSGKSSPFPWKKVPFFEKGYSFSETNALFWGVLHCPNLSFPTLVWPPKDSWKSNPMGARTRGDKVVKPPKGFSNHLWPPKELIFRFFIYFLFQKFAKFCPPTFFQFLWKYQYSCNF